MPWVRFSDDWYDDTDLIAAGSAALMLWPLLVSWSLRNLQDGFVPAGQIRRLVDWSELGVDPEQAIAPLVANGRLQEVAGGYHIVNFLKYQPSREKVLADRDAAKGRAARSRAAKSGGADGVREPCANAAVPPVPVPVPDNPSSSSTSDQVPAAVWRDLAKKKLARATGVGNATSWCSKVSKNDRVELGERAAWLWNTYDMTVSQLVDVLAAGGSSQLLNSLRKKEPA